MENQDQRVSARIQAETNTRRNLEHEFDSPDRPKAKTKAGPSPKKKPVRGKAPDAVPVQSEIASGSGDKAKYKNPESEHEPKGLRGRPFNSEQARAKAKAEKSSGSGLGQDTPRPRGRPRKDTAVQEPKTIPV